MVRNNQENTVLMTDEELKKFRRELREQEARINAADKALRKRNAEIYRKQRLRALEQAKLELERLKKIEDAEKQAAKDAYFDAVYLRNRETGYLGANYFEALLREIKDMLGSVAQGSIETNGNTIINKKRQNELAIDGANAHILLEEARKLKLYLDKHKAFLLSKNIYDQEADEWYNEAIIDVNKTLNNSELLDKELAYKELFVRKNTSALGYAFDEIARGVKWLGATAKGKQVARLERQNDIEQQYQSYVNDDNDVLGGAIADVVGGSKYNKSQILANQFIKTLQKENEGLDDEYEANRRHMMNSQEYWDITKAYDRVGQAYKNDPIWNAYHFFFNAPRTIGTSNGSPSQAASNVIRGVGTVASMAAAPVSGGTSFSLLYLSELAATPFDIKGGVDENHAEATDKQIESIIANLKDSSFTGDQIPGETYTNFINELKARSAKVWKAKGWTDELIRKFYGGNDGDRRAVSDFIQGLTRNVDIKDDVSGKTLTGKVVKNSNGEYTVTDTDIPSAQAYGNDLHFGDYMNPVVQEALDNALRGSLALFDADNMATMQELPIQKAAALLPFRGMKWGSRPFDRVVGRSVLQAGREAASTALLQAARYANTFRGSVKHGWNAGMASGIGAGTGLIGGTIAGTVGAAGGALAYGARRLSPSLDGFVRGLEKSIENRWQYGIDKVVATSEGRRIALDYGLRFAKSKTLETLSEMAEEGRQNLHKREDYGKLYGYGGMGYVDAIANDLAQGRKVLDAYLSALGIGDSPYKNDHDFWNDIKGVIPTVLFGNTQSAISTYAFGQRGIQEYNAAKALELSALLDRDYNNNNRAQLTNIVNASFKGRQLAVLDAIRTMQNADARRETPMFQLQDYETLKSDAEAVMNMARNKTIRAMLEAKDILYGTQEYATAVADLYILQQQHLDGLLNLAPYDKRIQEIYASDVYQSFIKSTVNPIIQNKSEDRAEAVKKAGLQAVTTEIDKINSELGLEPGSKKHKAEINKPEYQQRILDAQKSAEELAGQMFDLNITTQQILRKRVANKLIGLLELKLRMSTIDDYFKTMRDKFSIYTKRPDAVIVKNSIQKLIDDTRAELYRLNDKFRVGLSDYDLLLDLKGDDSFVGTNSKWDEELRQLEAYKALVQSSLDVTDSYYEQFRYGLVNIDGVWRYNPNEYHQRRKELTQATRLLKAGLKDAATDFMNAASNREVLAPDQTSKKEDVYRQRINKIIQAAAENNKIGWMLNDIASGDIITKFRDDVRKRYEEDKKAAEEAIKAKFKKSSTDPFTSRLESSGQTIERPQLLPRGDRFERRRKRALQTLADYKNKYESWKRGSLSALPIPFADAIVKAGFELAKHAIDGVYKFAEFVQDMTDVLREANVDIKDAFPYLRRGYDKRRQYFLLTDPSKLENMSSSEEIFDFSLFDDSSASNVDPIVEPFFDAMQRKFDEDSRKIINDDSFYDLFVLDEDGVHIYPNIVGIEHNNTRFGYNVQKAAETLRLHNTSDEEFRLAVIDLTKTLGLQFPVDFYVKYRNVEGIEEAVARRFYTFVDRLYVIDGNKVRNAAIAVALGKEDELDRTKYPGNLDQFISDAKKAFSELSGQGIRILNTKLRIYGTVNGVRMSIDADIIAVNDKGDIFVIDVRYTSYENMFEIMDKFSKYVGYSTREQIQRQVDAVDKLILEKFDRAVKEDYLLPVSYDWYSERGIQINWHEVGGNKKGLYPIKSRPQPAQTESVLEQKNLAQLLVDEINSSIAEYNEILFEASKYGSQNRPIDEITLLLFETVEEYQQYMDTLRERYDGLNTQTEEMRNLVQSQMQFEQTVWKDNQQTTIEIPQDVVSLMDQLLDKCRELDFIRDYILSLRPTEQIERDRINKMYQLVFEAQNILDEVLLNPDARNLNLTYEQELIASTMEVMAENKKNFGAMNVFMMKWWANKFATATEYINTIHSWMDTLYNHVMNDLDGHYALQEWYTSLLNNYFAALLENASEFAKSQPASLRQGIENLVSQARNFITEFNDKWGTLPDNDFQGPAADQAERINRMRVRWKAKYGMTKKHWPSIDEMSEVGVPPNRSFYYIMSISPTFVSSYKAQVGPAEDPQDHSTRFRLEEINGKIYLHINWYTGLQWMEKYLSFETDVTKFPQEYWEDLNEQNLGNQWFTRKVKAMLDYVKANPEWKITFTVDTDNGSIHYDRDGVLYDTKLFLFKGSNNEHDLYTITLSQKDRMGITRFIEDVTLNKTFYNVHTGSDLSIRVGSIGEGYEKGATRITTGLVVYKYNYGDGTGVWVPIPAVKIGDDASLLVDLIADYARGARVKDGYDILGLLKQRLYIADPTRRISKYNNPGNLITIGENGNVSVGKEQYNVFTGRKALVDRISIMSNSMLSEMLSSNMNSSADPVMSTVRQKIIEGALSIKLPNGFVIQREDITHDNKNGSYGSTWLGYMLRNNYMMTMARGAGYRQVNIDNLQLVRKDSDLQSKPAVQANLRRQAIGRRAAINAQNANNIQNGAGLSMTVSEDLIDKNRSVEEQENFVEFVLDYFRQVLGDNPEAFTEFIDSEFIRQVGETGRVIGITTSSIIQLSKYAPYSAAWHEAFHRILELSVSDKLRQQFYDMYSKKYNVHGDRAIAEGLADLFVSYMEHRKAVNDTKGFSKFYLWCKLLGFAAGLVWNVGVINAIKLFNFYRNINAGKYKVNTNIDKSKAERFKNLFNDLLYYQVNGVDFKYLADSGEVAEMVEGLSYYILDTYDIQKLDPDISEITIDNSVVARLDYKAQGDDISVLEDLLGTYEKDEDLTNIDFAFREVFEEGEKEAIIGTKGKDKGKVVGYRKTYPKFAALKPLIADYIKQLLNGDYKGKIEDVEVDDGDDIGENRNSKLMNNDKYDKVAFELSKLEGVNKRVKLFFSTIPLYTTDMQLDYSKNHFNCPSFIPIEKVFNVLVNAFHDVQTINELNEALRLRGLFDPMAQAVYSKYNELVKDVYKYDENGVITEIDFDKESFAIQILNTIRSQKNDFIVARSKTIKDHGKSIDITSSSLNRDQFNFPRQWSLYLQAGQVSVFSRNLDENGNWKFNSGQENTFNEVSTFFKELRAGLLSPNLLISILGNAYLKDSLPGIDAIKNQLILLLHRIGILFSRDALDYMLTEQFGGLGADQLSQFINQVGSASIQPFLDRVDSFSQNGKPNKANVQQGYLKLGFVINLAKWQGLYNRITTQQMSLGLNGKRLYSISQNSSISHIINMLNTLDVDNETIKTILGFNYNLMNDEVPIGSIIAKAILSSRSSGNPFAMKAHTYIGFKTDNRGDTGTEYLDEATVDDYMAKLTMLQKGYLIFPTLSDKGTYVIISFDEKSGVHIPGMLFVEVTNVSEDSFGNPIESTQTVVKNAPRIKFVGKQAYVIPHESVVNQMLEYAETEKAAIEKCMIDVDLLPEEAKVKNYHTKNKDKDTGVVVEPNGTRFLSLTKIAVVEDGKLNIYNLNNPNESSKRMLELANEKFFSKSLEERKEIMGLTLAIQSMNEVDTAIDLGIVKRVDRTGLWTDKDGKAGGFSISSSERSIMNLETTLLNESQIETLTLEILKTLPHKDYGTWYNIPTTQSEEKAFKYQVARSMAIASILSDATYRSIICSQEIQRCFSGHPGLFKVNYDIKAGKIKDSAFDIQKRIGGMISTGEDNVLNLPKISSTYVCAELKDYEVGSVSNIAAQLDKMFTESHVKEIFANKLIRLARRDYVKFYEWYKKTFDEDLTEPAEIVAERVGYSMTYDDIIQKAPDEFKSSLEKAQLDGIKYASSYKSKINVADGASYITDTMCENMLRMRGAYNNDVKKAFDILRGDEKYSWVQKRTAYDVVYKAVNIVTTKYTAYGFREHILNDTKLSDLAVAYYNKFALFPLFSCIATGKMNQIYLKMLNEGVDMVLMDSAVKVGSQGSIKFEDVTSTPFNKYIQSYAYLRRQLNTDPEEGDSIAMGTQMVKIALLNLRREKVYTDDRTGEDITGNEILDRFMSSIRSLSNIGLAELHEMFFTDGAVDLKKLSKYLKEQLNSRNANKALLEAVEVDKDGNLVSVLSATPDASWIESILISTVNKKVIDIITPGSSFVQRSVFAIEGKQKEGEGSIQNDANLPRNINGGDKLQMLNNDGSMDAVISMDYFDDILFKGRMKDMSFNEKRNWLIKNKIIGNTPDVKANTIGYRIPTQAQSSIHALRFVDVIEAVKSTIILPEEFTKITGSDFDIDHLYLCSYNYNDNNTTEFRKNSKEWHQNTIIDCLMTLLKDSDSTNILYKSIDNDTELITNISAQIEEVGSTKDDPYNFGTLHEQVIRKNDYITGKSGIAPYALNVTNQILTYLYGVRFKKTKFTEATGIERLDNVIDDDDHLVSSWLSAFINAHVDIVKDPYIAKLNVNKFTYNMSNLLIRCGFGDVTLWFLALPIIRELSKADEISRSQYSRDTIKRTDGRSYKEQVMYEAALKFIPEHFLTKLYIEIYSGSDPKRILDRIDAVLFIKNNKDVLEAIAKNPTAKQVTVKGLIYNIAEVQANVFFAWKSLEKYAMALSNLVLHTKIDTRKQGKTLIAQQQYFEAYKKLFENTEDSIWDLDSLTRLASESWIRLKTYNAIKAPQNILGEQTFNANHEFVKAVVEFGEYLQTERGALNVDTLNHISRSLQTAIKSEYIIKYAKEVLKMTDADIAGLFTGRDSVNKWLVMLKNAIETNPAYARLKNNHFLNLIYSTLEDKPKVARYHTIESPAFITVLDNVDDSRVNANLLIDGWTDLLNDENANVRLFARKMIVYAFLTSGEFKGWNKLWKYVPPAWLRGNIDSFESFSDHVKKSLKNSREYYRKYFDQVAGNNFMDYRFSKRYNQRDKNENGGYSDNFIEINTQTGIPIVKIAKPVTKDSESSVEKYITVRGTKYSGYGLDKYDLYKLAGFAPIEGSKLVSPVYVKIKKLGYHTDYGFDIYEYGWNMGYLENESQPFSEYDAVSAFERIKAAINDNPQFFDTKKIDAQSVSNMYFGFVLNQQVKRGENISSRGSDFAKRLTNPFNNETVEFRGTLFDNAEHAYLTWKSGQFNQAGYDAHGGKVSGNTDFYSNYQLMVDIITAKLELHPDLVDGIDARGGYEYLSGSTHNVVGDKYWESTGQNKFMQALTLAYTNVKTAGYENQQYDNWLYEETSWISNVLNSVNDGTHQHEEC